MRVGGEHDASGGRASLPVEFGPLGVGSALPFGPLVEPSGAGGKGGGLEGKPPRRARTLGLEPPDFADLEERVKLVWAERGGMDAIPAHAGVRAKSGVVSGGAGIVRDDEDETLDCAELGVDLRVDPPDLVAVPTAFRMNEISIPLRSQNVCPVTCFEHRSRVSAIGDDCA